MGVENLIVVETPDAVLVADKSRSQDVKHIVTQLQETKREEHTLQKHHHRAEHWIVVTGTAEITNGDKVLTLTENQSTYIPLGEVHRLANPGSIPLEII